LINRKKKIFKSIRKVIHKKDGIKVVLNGQGADEAFYGYEKYLIGYYLLDIFNKNPINFIKEFRQIKRNNYSSKYIFKQIFKSFLTKSKASFLRAKYQEKVIEVLSPTFVKKNYHKLNFNYRFEARRSETTEPKERQRSLHGPARLCEIVRGQGVCYLQQMQMAKTCFRN
jgi:asparagine synthetase B (glutamine-hydrolysing)